MFPSILSEIPQITLFEGAFILSLIKLFRYPGNAQMFSVHLSNPKLPRDLRKQGLKHQLQCKRRGYKATSYKTPFNVGCWMTQDHPCFRVPEVLFIQWMKCWWIPCWVCWELFFEQTALPRIFIFQSFQGRSWIVLFWVVKTYWWGHCKHRKKIYHALFIHSLIDGFLSSFRPLSITSLWTFASTFFLSFIFIVNSFCGGFQAQKK